MVDKAENLFKESLRKQLEQVKAVKLKLVLEAVGKPKQELMEVRIQ